MDIRKTITDFVCSELLDDDEPIGADDNLLADGMIDSLGMLRLVSFIEDTFGYKVPPEHFTINHFRTLDAIDTYLSSSMDGGDGD